MPSHKLDVRYSSEARTDINEILRYSEQRWGKGQRDAYRNTLRKTVATLATEPGIGRKRDELISGLKSHPVGSHIIYYLSLEDELRIVRVLHERRDPFQEEW